MRQTSDATLRYAPALATPTGTLAGVTVILAVVAVIGLLKA
jgi:hypothetical protein